MIFNENLDVNYIASQDLPLDISKIDFKNGKFLKRTDNNPLIIFFTYSGSKILVTLKRKENKAQLTITIIFGEVPYTVESLRARLTLIEEIRSLRKFSEGEIGITSDQKVIIEKKIILTPPVTLSALIIEITYVLLNYKDVFNFFKKDPHLLRYSI